MTPARLALAILGFTVLAQDTIAATPTKAPAVTTGRPVLTPIHRPHGSAPAIIGGPADTAKGTAMIGGNATNRKH